MLPLEIIVIPQKDRVKKLIYWHKTISTNFICFCFYGLFMRKARATLWIALLWHYPSRSNIQVLGKV